MVRVLLIPLLLITVTAAVHAQSEVECDILAFVADPASGVNVRSGPGKEFGIVRTVPKDPGRSVFTITGAKGEWLKITRAENSKAPSQTVFSGSGWVFAPVLAVNELRDHYKVFESPNKKSMPIEISLYDHILPLAGCTGRWVQVKLPQSGTGTANIKKTGWIPDGLWCGNPAYECES